MKVISLFFIILLFSSTVFSAPVYENDSSGNYVSGDIDDLVDAVLDGKKITVVIPIGTTRVESITSDRVHVFYPDATTKHVAIAHRLWNANTYYHLGDGEVKFSTAYKGIALFSTDGKEILKTDSGSTITNGLAMKWYVHN